MFRQSGRMNGDRLTGLDALRGIAAMIVVLMHSTDSIQAGHLAVDFFFMLSGFVMARTYEQRLIDGSLSAPRFFAARYKRLWPAMAAGATLGLLVNLWGVGATPQLWERYAFALLLVPAGATVPYVLNLPAWSIFYELLANALHGLLAKRLTRAVLLALVVVTGGGLAVAISVDQLPQMLPETTLQTQLLLLLRVAFSYGLGVLIFRTFGDTPPVKLPMVLGLVMLPAYTLLVMIWPFFLWQLPFIFVLGPIMLFAGMNYRQPDRMYELFGRLSFPLYAMHAPLLLLSVSQGLGAGPGVLAAIALALLWSMREPGRGLVARPA
jgi:peptidoglycan/LPS O-acetylase OafA/YrhL